VLPCVLSKCNAILTHNCPCLCPCPCLCRLHQCCLHCSIRHCATPIHTLLPSILVNRPYRALSVSDVLPSFLPAILQYVSYLDHLLSNLITLCPPNYHKVALPALHLSLRHARLHPPTLLNSTLLPCLPPSGGWYGHHHPLFDMVRNHDK
jgi:hypothetical protein